MKVERFKWFLMLPIVLAFSSVTAQSIGDPALVQKLGEPVILEAAQRGEKQTLFVEIIPSSRTTSLEQERIARLNELWSQRTAEKVAAEAATLKALQASMETDKRAIFEPLLRVGIEISQDFDTSPIVMVTVPAGAIQSLLASTGVRCVNRIGTVEAI